MAVLLREHGVEVLVDVRERPYGRKVLFNKKKLEDTHGPVKSAGLGTKQRDWRGYRMK